MRAVGEWREGRGGEKARGWGSVDGVREVHLRHLENLLTWTPLVVGQLAGGGVVYELIACVMLIRKKKNE